MSVIPVNAVRLASKTVMSGIQPTGVFHIGNVLGAVQAWVRFSQEAPADTKIVYMIADLHAITVPKEPELLRELRWQALASLLACGVDPSRCNTYFQSAVPAHTRLHWLLSAVSSMGYLSRMTQWKSKAQLSDSTSVDATSKISDVNLALFAYPTLQAADILVNEADYVPVGEDQAQHLELSRHLAQSFNHRFNHQFVVPKTVVTPFKKILSLRDPAKKMSKSDPNPASCLYITDTDSEIQSKLRKAVSDSIQGPPAWDPEARPALANLVSIAAGLEQVDPVLWLEDVSAKNHQQLKEAVAASVIKCISPIRKRYEELLGDRAYLKKVAEEGAMRARERTDVVYSRAAAAMGFL